MSLRSFHIVFVSVCTVLFAFMALWAFVISGETSLAGRVIGSVGIGGLLLMPLYGVYFMRKAKAIHL
jgi:hypothetical protein